MEKVIETKLHFAKVFTKLREEKPVEQIRIKDLCGNGGASRQTFYYHFIDKEDFLLWMLNYDLEKSYKSVMGPFDIEGVEKVVNQLLSDKSFYQAIFGGEGACTDVSFLSNFFYDYDTKTVKTAYHLSELNKEQQFIVKYHSYAISGVIINALNHKDELNPKDLAKEIYELMPDLLKEAYVKKFDRYY